VITAAWARTSADQTWTWTFPRRLPPSSFSRLPRVRTSPMCGDHDRCDDVMLPNGQRTIRYGVTWTMSNTGITSGRTRRKTPFYCQGRNRRRSDRACCWMTWIAVPAFSGPLHPACTDSPANPVTSTNQMSVRFGAHPVISSDGPQSRHVVLWGCLYPGHFVCPEVSGSGRSMRSAPERLELVDGGRYAIPLQKVSVTFPADGSNLTFTTKHSPSSIAGR